MHHKIELHRGFRIALAVLAALLMFALPAAPARAADRTQPCHLVLSNEHMPSVALERGVAFHRDFTVNLNACTFTPGAVSRRTLPSRPRSSTDGTLRVLSEHFGGPPLAADPNIFEREETWDCCSQETTYVENRQTFGYDGSVSQVSWLQTNYWTLNTGWYVSSGPSQWFNTPNPSSSVSTESSASFNNTTFPCGCQPCDHTLYAELRSYADGSWTHSSAFTGDPGQTICSGWIHVSEDWGNW